MTSPLYSELPQELLLDVEPMRPAGRQEEKGLCLCEGWWCVQGHLTAVDWL